MSFDATTAVVGSVSTVSIPFEQGDVFRPMKVDAVKRINYVSIPFEQGDVFRPQNHANTNPIIKSQSLSSRAMSFDLVELAVNRRLDASQSLSSRAMSFDNTN